MENTKITIGESSQFEFDPMLFDGWIIDETVSPYMDELVHAPQDGLLAQFLKGAASIAIEVRGTGYDWTHAARVYASAGRERGLDVETMQRLLNLAWRWCKASVTHWTDLVREWVCIGEHRQFYHVRSQTALTEPEFGALFDHLSPVNDCSIASFLFESEFIQRASFVAVMPREKPEMVYGEADLPVFCAAWEPEIVLAG